MKKITITIIGRRLALKLFVAALECFIFGKTTIIDYECHVRDKMSA